MNDDRLRDRGTIKWTSLMLPEHVEMVKEVWKEDERLEKGMIAEDQAVEIDFKLKRALSDDLTIGITHHNGFDNSYCVVKLISINYSSKLLKTIDQETREYDSISLINIQEIEFI